MSAVPTQTTFAQINTRSPFFVSFDTLETAATMELRIWVGDRVGNFPTDAQYTLVKRAVEGQVVFEIAELIRDYITQTNTLTSGNVWVQTLVTDGVDTSTVDYFATEGWNKYSESVQTQGSVSDEGYVALAGEDGYRRVMVAEGKNAVIPWIPQAENAIDWYYTKFDQNGAGLGSTTATSNAMANSRVQYASVTPSVSRVDFTWKIGAVTDRVEQVHVDTLRCGKFPVIELVFVNKYGAKQYFPFIMKSVERLRTESKRFNASTMNYANLAGGQGNHVANRYITDVKQSFTLNTDWIDEYYVEQFEQLLVSEVMWMRKDGVLSPVTLSTSSMKRKTHLNDRLINYTVEVELATNYINDIR